MKTNKAIIKGIEHDFNIKLSFYFLDSYGLYCEGYQNKKKLFNTNVYDSGSIISQKDRKYYLRDFLLNFDFNAYMGD